MELILVVEEKVLSVVTKALEMLAGEISYRSFETILKEELYGLGCEMLKTVLEELDRELKADKERKLKWEVVRKDDVKGLLTPFGLVTTDLPPKTSPDFKLVGIIVN